MGMNGRSIHLVDSLGELRSVAACGAFRRPGVGMSEATNSLFVETAIAAVSRDVRTGVLPYQSLQTMIRCGRASSPGRIRPCSTG
jgi:hypothetical protein